MQSTVEIQRSHGLQLVPKVEAPAVIQLDHVHKTYTMGDVEVHALRGISLEIQAG